MYVIVFVSNKKFTLAGRWQGRDRVKVMGSSHCGLDGGHVGDLCCQAVGERTAEMKKGKRRIGHDCDKWRGEDVQGIKERIMPETLFSSLQQSPQDHE